MARIRPKDRFPQLVAAATRVLIASGGFRRTQIGEVAEELGVAKGTLYLYVESKEALFDLVLRAADRPDFEEPELPVATPPAGATLDYLRDRLAAIAIFPALARAEEAHPGPQAVAGELVAIVDELFDVVSGNRTAIKIIGSSAHDLPELAELWYGEARGTLNRRLAAYLSTRAEAGLLLDMPDPAATARFVTETVSWFAMHRFWDPQPDAFDDTTARATVRAAVLRTLLPPEQLRAVA